MSCEVQQNELARHLLLVHYNTPLHDESRLVPGQDYGGASTMQWTTRRRGYFSQVHGSIYPYLTHNPSEALQTDEHCIWETVQTITALLNRPTYLLQDSPASVGDPFSRLPYEVSMIVLTYLPSLDVCKVRLASRSAARISSPQQLPQGFWRSRFYLESELGFVFARPSRQMMPEKADWRDMYQKARATLSEPELFPGFKNRHRIWQCVQHAANAVKVRLRNPHSTSKVPYAAMEPPLMQGELHGSWVCADAALAPVPTNPVAQSDLASHCRVLEMHKLAWPAAGDGRLTLKASFVDYCGYTYISGLQLERPTLGDAGRGVEAVGFSNSTNFQILELGDGLKLDYIKVSLTPIGLTGVQFHFEGQESELDSIIGSFSAPGSSGGMSTLMVSKEGKFSGLVLGLDVLAGSPPLPSAVY